MSRKVLDVIRITPKEDETEFDFSAEEFVVQTEDGYYWASDGNRSARCFSSFLDVIRFSLHLRNIEAHAMTDADEIVGAVESKLKGERSSAHLTRREIIRWIGEFRQKYTLSLYAYGEICEAEDDFFGPLPEES